MRKAIGVLAGSVLLCGALHGEALAESNPLGFHAGAGVGIGTPVDTYLPGFLRGNEFGWNVFAGIRPIPWLGAEVQYMDFGYAHQHSRPLLGTPFVVTRSDDSHAYAAAAFAVGYLPLSFAPPPVDFYAKIGAARLWSSDDYSIYNATTAIASIGHISQNETDFAYGGGLQVHFGELAFRVEYEAIESTYSNPSLVTLGIVWTP